MELILTGDQLPAREALALGLVTRVVPPEETVLAALRLAARIATMPPVAVLAAKAASAAKTIVAAISPSVSPPFHIGCPPSCWPAA